jgi:hypothetical protein
MTITIANKRTFKGAGIYVGRPTPLGNPFEVQGEDKRDWSCNQYAIWFAANKDKPAQKTMLDSLIRMYKQSHKLTLVCWCAPKRCHAEAIRDHILAAVGESEPKNEVEFNDIEFLRMPGAVFPRTR